ncbi:Transcriptional regulator GlxA family, contains an amidase domain and an AraC-type DNA-binding HTH domain [Variovorax sp. OK605]|uniref:GlxA family transcriptional regulator n=1 Tax=unclassified Variovorax TaxID=663243 RepID=UPI0008C50B71|nr:MULTISPECIES: helix-turn-helix domain-containing protein [unclassified Variovorax]SEJ44137.1 Transcriptional regulator GlxA family, contains an amidase domain and an AraC-type DNA-binding HTH domain [Variovorax sp. OK202]SFC42896.1 Transcriptional regulator GlxA family, contains an amidase domain and an AraC-type DNA-binding HTH domain [Variovorax sp. OK212]SFP33083.1 Transcriptional regulator GlxA family, contains an amidase domain and an AraC-type DNA-binding HTH domain [Variovorax sp. OK60
MKIDVLALDGVFDTGLSTVLDVFTTANELAAMLQLDVAPFDVSVTGVRKRVRTSQGFTVPVARSLGTGAADWLIVPALGCKMPDTLEPALQRADVRDACAALKTRSNERASVAAACIGTFVLAEAGVLDHHKATTTWWLATLFRQRYPAVQLEDSRMLVSSGHLVTAGAALSHVDMALWIVRQASPELATLVARYLIVDSRPSQSAYVISDHLSHSDPLVERFERWARGRLADGFSLDEAAQAAGTSKRTLARRMQQVLGKSPLSYVQDLRVERAVHLLKTSDKSLEQIAGMVGYADGVTLRTLLRQRLGRGVREVRLEA